MSSDFIKQLKANEGKKGASKPAKDPVNEVMIRHWCEAMGDMNPNYLDPDHAQKGPHKGMVAPPAMLNAWNMAGLHPQNDQSDPAVAVYSALAEAGYIGIVASNSEHTYNRYLKPGERLTATQKVSEVSEEKQTALGVGHFVTTETEYKDESGEMVGTMLFRVLKFKPGTGRSSSGVGNGAGTGGDSGGGASASPAATGESRPNRPTPSMNSDTEFFWEAAKKDELHIQTCTDCGAFHHPPLVRCSACGSANLGSQKVSGKGKLYSHCRVHYPPLPAFKEPPLVGLIELEEGIRIVSNVTDCPPDKLHIGMDMEAWFYRSPNADGTALPQFRPPRAPRRETNITAEEISPGMELPFSPIPITRTLIISAAIASRDYQDVHHNHELAQMKGSKDIFMNILTSSGLTSGYLGDWAGPDARLANLKIRLGVPNYPHDCMVMTGKVESVQSGGAARDSGAGGADGAASSGNIVSVSFEGRNSLGPHISGTADLILADEKS